MTTPASTPGSGPGSTPGSGPATGGRVQLALAPALRVRLLGTGLVAIGVVVALAGLLTWLAGVPAAYLAGLVVLAGVGVLALVGLLGVRHWVVRLDAEGYRVRVLRSAQARSARWTDVLDLQTARIGDQRCAVLRLRDGRTTALPVDVIEGGPTRLTELLAAHLDRGHGYKRLR